MVMTPYIGMTCLVTHEGFGLAAVGDVVVLLGESDGVERDGVRAFNAVVILSDRNEYGQVHEVTHVMAADIEECMIHGMALPPSARAVAAVNQPEHPPEPSGPRKRLVDWPKA